MEYLSDGARHVLVARVPRDIEVTIEDNFLIPLGTSRPTMGYHITLLGSFHLIEGQGHAAFSHIVQRVCGRWRPLHVSVTGIGVFEKKDDNVIYLRLADSHRLVALHEELLEATRGWISFADAKGMEGCKDPYLPHITLGLGLTDQELAYFFCTAAGRVPHITFRISELWLAAQEPSEPWRYVVGYPLDATRQGELLSPEPHS
ncbi:MAG: 2'-5' RNA ligase family protein [Chloroflexota bacterium]|nr:2'-5' RNA ligase family protein [Chloroflexota bacterium]